MSAAIHDHDTPLPPLPPWARTYMPGSWAQLASVWVGEVTIGPDDAQWILEHCTGYNRPLSQVTVKELMTYMRRGKFIFNGETLVFSADGNVLNAQHRLTAVSRLDKDCRVPFLVVYGVDKESFDTYDQQRRRSTTQILAIHGSQRRSADAPTALDFPDIYSSAGTGALHYLLSGQFKAGHQIPLLPIGVVCDIVRDENYLPGLAASVLFAGRHRRYRRDTADHPSCKRYRGPAAVALYHWLFACVDRQASDEFWTALLTSPLSKMTPWQETLHDRLSNNETRREKLSPDVTHAYVITTWNMIRGGKAHNSSRSLRFGNRSAVKDVADIPHIAGWNYPHSSPPFCGDVCAARIPELAFLLPSAPTPLDQP